jgi:hypothetical protein
MSVNHEGRWYYPRRLAPIEPTKIDKALLG